MPGNLYRLKPLQNVAAGQTATLSNIPQGETYEAFFLVLGGTTLTKGQLDGIRFRLGGKLIVNLKGSDLDAINQYYLRKASSQVLPLWFYDKNAPTPAERNIGCIDTSQPYSDFECEIDIDGAAVAPTLQLYCRRNATLKDPRIRSLIRAYLGPSIQNFGAAQEYNLEMNTGSKGGALLCAAHVFNSNTISQIQMLRDAIPLIQNGLLNLVQYEEQEMTRFIQSGLVSADFCMENNPGAAIPTLRPNGTLATFEFKATLTAADTLRVVTELLTSVDNI